MSRNQAIRFVTAFKKKPDFLFIYTGLIMKTTLKSYLYSHILMPGIP
jgi:hypothetical protein